MTDESTKNKRAPRAIAEALPPLLFPAHTSADKVWMAELRRKGKIRQIAPRLYTSVPASKTESTVRSCWADIVNELFPDVTLSYRSALEFKPDPTNTLYLTGSTNRRVQYPGLTLEFIRGPGPLETDMEFRGFHASSLARALLENVSVTKRAVHRALPREKLEERLETEMRVSGEKGLNKIRVQAKRIAEEFGWKTEFKKLNELIGGVLGTRSTKALKTQLARARAKGRPFDPACNLRLDLLASELLSQPLPNLKEPFKTKDHFRNKAFFEAYFSNYIEGTKFKIEEAEQIVFDAVIPAKRPKDAHDILGTFQIVSDLNEIKRCPRSTAEFEPLLRSRHRTLMSERSDVDPGEFKTRTNQAGNTHFVDPQLVTGTLEKGFQKYLDLPSGLPRAIYMMFLVAEVHPFNDGNGRIARIMMNAELLSQGLTSIIVPTVYREDYVGALRALSRRDRPTPLIHMLQRAQTFSNLEFSPYKTILKTLTDRNWFEEPNEAKIVE